MKVASIVEGDGEVAALPILLRRLCAWRTPEAYVDVQTPIRVRRDRFLNREEEFERYLHLAAAKSGDDGWILVLLDADDDCPAELGNSIAMRASEHVPHRPVAVVIANREFEAWFIASADSLSGFRGFAHEGGHLDPERPRDAKGWIRARMAGGTYGETTDQPAFATHMSLEQAEKGSRSFRKLCSEWDRKVKGLS
ncbi:DUF4276 family protein [Pseudoxanthomonas suwonensis]